MYSAYEKYVCALTVCYTTVW